MLVASSRARSISAALSRQRRGHIESGPPRDSQGRPNRFPKPGRSYRRSEPSHSRSQGRNRIIFFVPSIGGGVPSGGRPSYSRQSVPYCRHPTDRSLKATGGPTDRRPPYSSHSSFAFSVGTQSLLPSTKHTLPLLAAEIF